MRQCVELGLVEGEHLSVDGSFVEANAAKQSRIPQEQLAEAAQVKHIVRQYLQELEQQNPVEEPVHTQDQVSTTDPDSWPGYFLSPSSEDCEAMKSSPVRY